MHRVLIALACPYPILIRSLCQLLLEPTSPAMAPGKIFLDKIPQKILNTLNPLGESQRDLHSFLPIVAERHNGGSLLFFCGSRTETHNLRSCPGIFVRIVNTFAGSQGTAVFKIRIQGQGSFFGHKNRPATITIKFRHNPTKGGKRCRR